MTYILQKAQKETNYKLWIGLAVVVVIIVYLSSSSSSKSRRNRNKHRRHRSGSESESGSVGSDYKPLNSRLSSWFSNRSKSKSNTQSVSGSRSVPSVVSPHVRTHRIRARQLRTDNSRPYVSSVASSVYSPNVRAHSPNNIRVNSPNTIYLHLNAPHLCECRKCRKNKKNNINVDVPIDELVDKITKSYISKQSNRKYPVSEKIDLDRTKPSISPRPGSATHGSTSPTVPVKAKYDRIENYSENDSDKSAEHYNDIGGFGNSKWNDVNLNDYYKTLS
jgi:hypothetical protein